MRLTEAVKMYLKKAMAKRWMRLGHYSPRIGDSTPSISLGRGVPILCYHSVSPASTESRFRVSPATFEKHIGYICKNYRAIRIDEFLDVLRGGRKRENAVVITFDDGYLDNFEFAYPILKRYECPAIVYVATGFVGKETILEENGEKLIPMTWSNIREMHGSGLIEIGAHTHTHRILSKLPFDEAKLEINKSKSILENMIGCEIRHFAYPNGRLQDFTFEIEECVKSMGFLSSCSTNWSTDNSIESLFRLNRIMIDAGDDIEILSMKLSGAFDYLKHVHGMKYKAFSWVRNVFGIGKSTKIPGSQGC